MLSQVLTLMAQEQNMAVSEIAQKLGWTRQRVENAMSQLERMGYLEKNRVLPASCGKSQCSGCFPGKNNSCHGCSGEGENLTVWVMTERGKQALS